jgi:phospholipid/cholesterol/gamma-HCH transport system ATP-binding protein
MDQPGERIPFAELASGLLEPAAGSVRFTGADWRAAGAYEQGRMRGRIGRVYETPAFISNLNLDENITLSQRHHTRRDEHDIMAEAARLAGMAGLSELPRGRPHTVRANVLRKAGWVRAFLGKPDLVVLEKPEHGVDGDDLRRLQDLARLAREWGGAVLWITDREAAWEACRTCGGSGWIAREGRVRRARKEGDGSDE